MTGIILGLFSAFFASLFSVLNGLMIKSNSAISITIKEFISVMFFITIFDEFDMKFPMLLRYTAVPNHSKSPI